jgi:hypothetical protein
MNKENFEAGGFSVDTSVADKTPESKQKPTKPSLLHEVVEWLDIMVVAIIAVTLIFSFVFRVATIDGPSMENTFFTGDKVIISNFLHNRRFSLQERFRCKHILNRFITHDLRKHGKHK